MPFGRASGEGGLRAREQEKRKEQWAQQATGIVDCCCRSSEQAAWILQLH
jgi:hypothetical protein